MCTDCGCSDIKTSRIDGESVALKHAQESMVSEHQGARLEISIMRSILEKNNHQAEHNRQHLATHQIFCTNWISAPGSGKTSLLERFIADFVSHCRIWVIEGDLQTENDANRIRKAGAEAVQINTGSACHLDAEMVHHALHKLDMHENGLLFIENVGNMVCPTAFDLGEALKVAVISTTEGEDKPVKYPDLILASQVLLINKIDLIPYLDYDLEKTIRYAKQVNPDIHIFPVSAKTGEGLAAFYDWFTSLDVNHSQK